MNYQCHRHPKVDGMGCADCALTRLYAGTSIHARATDPLTAMPGPKDPTEDMRRIIALLQQHPDGLNSREISEALGRPRECITPCLRPMQRSGFLQVLGKRHDHVTNCTVLIWGISQY